MRKRSLLTLSALALALAAQGCNKSASESGTGTTTAGAGVASPGTSPAIEAWKQAKLEVTSFAPTEVVGLKGARCRGGAVAGLESVLCDFADEAAAIAAEDAGLEAVGEHTGAALAAGKSLLIVADRKKVDPSGKALNQVVKTFRDALAPPAPSSSAAP